MCQNALYLLLSPTLSWMPQLEESANFLKLILYMMLKIQVIYFLFLLTLWLWNIETSLVLGTSSYAAQEDHPQISHVPWFLPPWRTCLSTTPICFPMLTSILNSFHLYVQSFHVHISFLPKSKPHFPYKMLKPCSTCILLKWTLFILIYSTWHRVQTLGIKHA